LIEKHPNSVFLGVFLGLLSIITERDDRKNTGIGKEQSSSVEIADQP